MRIKNSILNTISAIISMVILSILGFISTKYFIDCLGIEYNGINGTFTNIISILAITELGLGGAITYNLYKPIVDKDYKKISAIMIFYKKCYRIVGCVIIALALITTVFIQIFLKDLTLNINYVRFLFILFALNTGISYFFSYNRNLFYAYQQNYIVVVIDFIFRTLKIILQIISLVLWENYVIFLIINIIFTFLANLVIHLLAKRTYKEIKITSGSTDKEVEKNVLGYVKGYAVIQLLSTSINFTDNLIISSFINVIAAGLYTNYNLIFSQINKIIVSFFNGIGASIGNLVAEDDKNKRNIVFINLEYLSFFMASFCACCFIFLVDPFIRLWIGAEYLLAISILIVLVFNFYLSIHRQPINYFLTASGLFKKMIKPLLIESIINLAVSIILAIKVGLIGVFIGTAVSGLVGWIYTSIIIYKHNNMKPFSYLFRQLKFFIITIIEIGILYLIFKLYIPSNLIFKIAYILLLCIIISNILSLIIVFKNNEVSYLKLLIIKLKNKLIKKVRH